MTTLPFCHCCFCIQHISGRTDPINCRWWWIQCVCVSRPRVVCCSAAASTLLSIHLPQGCVAAFWTWKKIGAYSSLSILFSLGLFLIVALPLLKKDPGQSIFITMRCAGGVEMRWSNRLGLGLVIYVCSSVCGASLESNRSFPGDLYTVDQTYI